MTDRYHSFLVVLEKDVRDDDADDLLKAIACLRGVVSVTGNITDPVSIMAEQRAKAELGKKVFEALGYKQL